MSNVIITPLMNLPNPVPSVDPGPDYANNLSNSLNIIDGHNHSAGSGNQINPAGINITSDLTFNDNNATNLRSVRFSPQSTPISGGADLGCLYESGVDLYYNDGNGNQIKMTSGGAVNATSSGIASGTATASFSGGVLVVNEAANTPANIQVGSVLIGTNTASPNFVEISSPSAIAASYSLNLPAALPLSNSVLSVDTSGNISTISQASLVPTGSIIMYGGSSAPGGYLICDGSSYSTTTYAALYAVIGTTFGSGSGSFNVPNMQRQVPMGSGGTQISGPLNTVGSQGGSEVITLSTSQIPTHTHHTIANAPINTQPVSASTAITVNQSGVNSPNNQLGGANTTPALSLTDGGSVGGGSHSNVQPSLVLNFIIKT